MANELGIFLEKLRGKMSLREAAKKSGLSHTYIRDLEFGVNRASGTPIRPTPDTLSKLSEAYNYPYEELMKMAGYMEAETKKELADRFADYIDRDFTNETIIKLMQAKFRIDDTLLSDEEIYEFIDWVRFKRATKKKQQTAGKATEL